MKINFDYPTEQLQAMHNIALVPGENDIPDEVAEELIAGSEALVVSIAETKKKREVAATGKKVSPATEAEVEEARKSLKGKGLFTAAVSPAPALSAKKGEKGGKG